MSSLLGCCLQSAYEVFVLLRTCEVGKGRVTWNNSLTWATPPVCWGSVKRMSRWAVWVVSRPCWLLLSTSQGGWSLEVVSPTACPAWHV